MGCFSACSQISTALALASCHVLKSILLAHALIICSFCGIRRLDMWELYCVLIDSFLYLADEPPIVIKIFCQKVASHKDSNGSGHTTSASH